MKTRPHLGLFYSKWLKMADFRKYTVRSSDFNETFKEWFLCECSGYFKIFLKTRPHLDLVLAKVAKMADFWKYTVR